MSIYPVYLASWFPNKGNKDHLFLHQSGKMMVEYGFCKKCGKKPKWKKAWGHHSIPWGNGDIWCSKECLRSKT